MKIECSSCQAVAEAQLSSVSRGKVSFRCGACNAINSVLREATPTSVDDESERCPKCSVAIAEDGKACGGCGLSRERFSSYQGGNSRTEDAIVNAWERLEEDWENAESHKTYVQEVAAVGDFRSGAAMYRNAAADSSKKERCEEMLGAIQKMATAALLASKPRVEEEEEPYSKVLLFFIVLILLAIVGGIYVLQTGNSSASTQELEPKKLSPMRGGSPQGR